MLYTGSGVYSVVTVIRSLVVPCLYLGDLRDDVLEKLKVNIIYIFKGCRPLPPTPGVLALGWGRSPEKNYGKTFEYTCPFCNGAVRSGVRSGLVNHRKHCGKQFRVTDGCVRNKRMAYRCPFCDAIVASTVMTGQVDHRSVCGNRFYVRGGSVSNTTRQHAHTCPQCQTVVWSARAAGRIHAQHKTPAGSPCPQTRWNSDGHKSDMPERPKTLGTV